MKNQIKCKTYLHKFCENSLKFLSKIERTQSRGQSYKTFYTLGQIYNCVLKHENNALAQTFVVCNVRTQHPDITTYFRYISHLTNSFLFIQDELFLPHVGFDSPISY